MLSVFIKPESSKELYFKLNNSLQIFSPVITKHYKIHGVYAIYKDGVCYYVGQSKNLPSRISTHLCGKYALADRVELFFVDGDFFPDYIDLSKDKQKTILEASESYLIDKLKPVENILVSAAPKDRSDVFWRVTEGSPDAHIYIDGENITIVGDPFDAIDAISEKVMFIHNSIKGGA